MADVLFLIITVAFFAVAIGFVRLCDKVIGPDADHADAQGTGEADPETVTVTETEPAVAR